MSSRVIKECIDKAMEELGKIDKENDSLITMKDNKSFVTMPNSEYKKLIKKTYRYEAYESEKNFVEDVAQMLVKKFGSTLQLFVAVEEMAELTQALSKDMRGQGNLRNIVEEIIDVEIMMAQLKIIYEINDEAFRNKKMEKLKEIGEKIGSND